MPLLHLVRTHCMRRLQNSPLIVPAAAVATAAAGMVSTGVDPRAAALLPTYRPTTTHTTTQTKAGAVACHLC